MKSILLIATIATFILILLVGYIAIFTETDVISDKKYLYHCPTYSGGKIMGELFKNMGFKHTTNSKQAGVYLPCGYTGVERELYQFNPTRGQIILAIDGCDQIVAKNGLWKVLSEKYGREKASQLTPRSYVTNSPTDIRLLEQEYNPRQIYIMKKNVQRQQGLQLSRDLPEMLRGRSGGYAVIQKYLMNPLLIDGRKFDMRVYLLVIQNAKGKRFYRHKAGRCHYTSQDFNTHSLEKAIHIPTGYKEDDTFKDRHPETLEDMQEYLNSQNGSGDTFFTRMDEMLSKCCVAFREVLGRNKRYADKNITCCQLFGIDVLSDDALHPLLIEINKGPEMAWSSEVEHQYKRKVLADVFNLLGYNVQKRTASGFIPLCGGSPPQTTRPLGR